MRVLFITESSLTKPILRSQGLPHLKALAQRGHEIFLLSFESPLRGDQAKEYDRIVGVYQDSIRFLCFRILPAKIVRAQLQMLLIGPIVALFFVLWFRIHCIHARSYVPAILALVTKVTVGTRMIFDMRGLFIDEMISWGVWKENTFVVRMMRFFEKQCILKADDVVVVSEAFKKYLLTLEFVKSARRDGKFEVIPNCVSLERFRSDDHNAARKRLNVENKIVLVYAGSLDSHQRPLDMVRFFSAFSKISDQAFFLFLTYGSVQAANVLFENSLIDPLRYRVLQVNPDDVPEYLSAGNCAILLRNEELLNRVACPLKFAEYLAAGLPVLISGGIGDTESIVRQHSVGVVLDDLTDENLGRAAQELTFSLEKENSEKGRSCRHVTQLYFSFNIALERYADIYRSIQA